MKEIKDISYSGKVKPKILMVDDKPENLLSLEKVLADFDVELIRANSGNEALKLTLHHDFALALLDIQMPEMDGYELAEILRDDEKTTNIPIIFISAIFTNKLNIFNGYEKGAFSFITKPFEPIELQNKVSFFIEKYHAEKAFEDSQKKYLKLYNSSPDMLFSVNAKNGLITGCNKTLLDISEFDQSELMNRSMHELFEPSSSDKVKNAFQELKESGSIENLELVLIEKNGTKLDVLLNASLIDDNGLDEAQFNCSLRDITELKNARNQLLNALEELKLNNKELEKFIYLTSHDLQEPMLTVLSFVGLLQEEFNDKLDDTAKEYIQYSVIAANRMKELITSLLDYLRIGHKVNVQELDLNEVLEKVIEEMQVSIQNSKTIIQSAKLPAIKGVESEMKNLFHNFISNAIKFSKNDVSPIIKIEVEDKGEFLDFSIKDNGIGINEKQFEKVFQLFKQAHERGKYEGMGVGMAVCKKIIELNGGTINIESEEGVGTTFKFTLPKNFNRHKS